ncbi:13967_t:CDS:2, partial [Racocetra persica]
RLLDELICLLKPFYEAITIFSGSTYPTLNLIYPIMRLFIKKFALSDEQTKDDYADLLFEPREQINDNQSQLITNDENSDKFNDEIAVDTEGLYDLVKTASYLSLQEYWEVLEETGLIAFAESSSMLASNPAITNDLVSDLYNNEESDNTYEETEVDCYLHEPIQKR